MSGVTVSDGVNSETQNATFGRGWEGRPSAGVNALPCHESASAVAGDMAPQPVALRMNGLANEASGLGPPNVTNSPIFC